MQASKIMCLVFLWHFSSEGIKALSFKIIQKRDFPGGPVVKNLAATAGDMGSLIGRGRSHLLWGN